MAHQLDRPVVVVEDLGLEVEDVVVHAAALTLLLLQLLSLVPLPLHRLHQLLLLHLLLQPRLPVPLHELTLNTSQHRDHLRLERNTMITTMEEIRKSAERVHIVPGRSRPNLQHASHSDLLQLPCILTTWSL